MMRQTKDTPVSAQASVRDVVSMTVEHRVFMLVSGLRFGRAGLRWLAIYNSWRYDTINP